MTHGRAAQRPTLTWLETLPHRVSGAAAWILSPRDLAGDLPTANQQDRAAAEGRPPHERSAFLRRRAALRALVGRHLDVRPELVSITAGLDGVPRVVNPDAALHVSVSHREPFVALAIAPARIGIDLERLNEPAEPAWNILTQAEQRALADLPQAERWHGFLHYWTAKEAYLKAIGTGLWREPRDIEIGGLGTPGFQVLDRGNPVAITIAEHRNLEMIGVPLLAACVVL